MDNFIASGAKRALAVVALGLAILLAGGNGLLGIVVAGVVILVVLFKFFPPPKPPAPPAP